MQAGLPATVSGLQPATLYFYRCGAPTPTGGYSAEFTFRTPPAQAPRPTPPAQVSPLSLALVFPSQLPVKTFSLSVTVSVPEKHKHKVFSLLTHIWCQVLRL